MSVSATPTSTGPVIRHARVTTGSIAGLSTGTNVTVTWGTPFDDANYTVVAVVLLNETGDSLLLRRVLSQTASGCVVSVSNPAAIAKTGGVHAIAVHD